MNIKVFGVSIFAIFILIVIGMVVQMKFPGNPASSLLSKVA